MEPGKAENVRSDSPKRVISTVVFRLPAPTELAWAAGFFDGEGHAYFHPRHDPRRGRDYQSLGLMVSQAEPATLYRFRYSVGGLGRIFGPYRNGGYKPMWQWRATNLEHIQAVAAMLWSHLSVVKRNQIAAALRGGRQYRATHPDLRLKENRVSS